MDPARNPTLTGQSSNAYGGLNRLAETEVFIWDRDVADARATECKTGACLQVPGMEYQVAVEQELTIEARKGRQEMGIDASAEIREINEWETIRSQEGLYDGVNFDPLTANQQENRAH